MSDVAQLASRLEALERAVFGGGRVVSGWDAAARLIGVSTPTIKRMAKKPGFPKPASSTTYKRGPKTCIRPTWKRSDLLPLIT